MATVEDPVVRWAVGDYRPACDRAVERGDLDALALLADHHPHSEHCSGWEVLAWPCPAASEVLDRLFTGELKAHRVRTGNTGEIAVLPPGFAQQEQDVMTDTVAAGWVVPPVGGRLVETGEVEVTEPVMRAVAAVRAQGLGEGLAPDELAQVVRVALSAVEE